MTDERAERPKSPVPSDEHAGQAQSVSAPDDPWWKSAVIYQIYPRSFADFDGDGIGDLRGVTEHLYAIADLGVDAIWLSPFYPSPQRDAGYDVSDYCNVDPLFGDLADFDALLDRAHAMGLRVIVDVVPNHTSSDHPWFLSALTAREGSPERDRYIFRKGRGSNGELPPNNWPSVFGGSAWTRTAGSGEGGGEWYLHIFDVTQPDLNWESPWVRERFREVLRFWLDRGVDGFRVDVAHGLIKETGLPDVSDAILNTKSLKPQGAPYWGQGGVHDIYRDWRAIIDEYGDDRVLVAEAWVEPLSKMALWVRADEMHHAFNFPYLMTGWDANAFRSVVDDSIAAFSAVGAVSTWVLSNHDAVRHGSRLASTTAIPWGDGIGPKTASTVDTDLALRRARSATMLMLALPGSSYLYQGEELGLPESVDIPDEARQDPTWIRSNHERYGRDGSRIPLPWNALEPAFGFNATGKSWLPQPADWGRLARDTQIVDNHSTLALYKRALRLRREHRLGRGSLAWLPVASSTLVAFTNGSITVVGNFGTAPARIPAGDVILQSDDLAQGLLPPDTAAWLLS